MSLLSWLLPKSKHGKTHGVPESSGLSRMEPTRPVNGLRAGAKHRDTPPVDNAQPANRKNERMARRELLYTVVRDSMTRAGMLSASYKFKVLSLDARGRQFLIMVDLSREAGDETAALAEIEALIAQAAKSRYDIIVTSVYWRLNEHVAVGAAGVKPIAARATTPSQPVPLESRPGALDSHPVALEAAPVHSGPAPMVDVPPSAAVSAMASVAPVAVAVPPLARPGSRFEPIEADEVDAFKKALAAGIARPARPQRPASAPAAARSFDGEAKHGPQSYTLLTGFEDTEMPDQEARMPALSSTQYGDLR